MGQTHDGKENRINYIQDTLPVNDVVKPTKREYDDITTIVVHHDGSYQSKGYTAYDYASWHILPKSEGGRFGKHGAPTICYHYHINAAGEIFKTNDLTNVGWHAGNWDVNVHSIGIVLSGRFTEEDPTEAQLENLDWLIKELKFDFGRSFKIYGHKEISKIPTGCPGNLNVDKLREDHE